MTYHSDTILQNWSNLTLAEQLGNIGSEVSRMLKWREKDRAIADRAFERMSELLNETIAGETENRYRLRELARLRECINTYWDSGNTADILSLTSLVRYFDQFAVLANKNRHN